MTDIDWDTGSWLNAPAAVRRDDDGLTVESVAGSDFWRYTSYGFLRHSGHALLVDFPDDSAMEVCFEGRYVRQFDQAGLFLCFDEEHWAKTGIEMVDAAARLGAVITAPHSDWSTSTAPGWETGPITVRVSRRHDALTIRAKRENEEWELVRVFTLAGEGPLRAGPYLCSPEGPGLAVRFISWRLVAADDGLHED